MTSSSAQIGMEQDLAIRFSLYDVSSFYVAEISDMHLTTEYEVTELLLEVCALVWVVFRETERRLANDESPEK